MQIPLLSQLFTHHGAAPANAALQVKAAAAQGSSGSGASGNSSSNPATPAGAAIVTANDFLSLLVTEIQNQDPTTQTDPMQYITQLVDVNNLEQLVQINQNTTPPSATSPTANIARSANGVTGLPAAASSSSATTAAASAHPPLGSNSHIAGASVNAVARAFTQAPPPTSLQSIPVAQVQATQAPLQPEVMRALEHSIPGATFGGAGGNLAAPNASNAPVR